MERRNCQETTDEEEEDSAQTQWPLDAGVTQEEDEVECFVSFSPERFLQLRLLFVL